MAAALQSFFAKASIGDGCWDWDGARDRHGYGSLRVKRRTEKAYRFSYLQLVGPIPAGLELDHLCRNTSCVRPDHLEAVTHRENIRRGVIARRRAA